jgi:hypothetical protein
LRKRKIIYKQGEEQSKKKLKSEEKLKKKWEESGYTSCSIILQEEEEDIEVESDFSDENDKEINFLTGDATKPQPFKNQSGPFIIVK